MNRARARENFVIDRNHNNRPRVFQTGHTSERFQKKKKSERNLFEFTYLVALFVEFSLTILNDGNLHINVCSLRSNLQRFFYKFINLYEKRDISLSLASENFHVNRAGRHEVPNSLDCRVSVCRSRIEKH